MPRRKNSYLKRAGRLFRKFIPEKLWRERVSEGQKNCGNTQSDRKTKKTEEIPAKKGPETGIPRNSAEFRSEFPTKQSAGHDQTNEEEHRGDMGRQLSAAEEGREALPLEGGLTAEQKWACLNILACLKSRRHVRTCRLEFRLFHS